MEVLPFPALLVLDGEPEKVVCAGLSQISQWRRVVYWPQASIVAVAGALA